MIDDVLQAHGVHAHEGENPVVEGKEEKSRGNGVGNEKPLEETDPGSYTCSGHQGPGQDSHVYEKCQLKFMVEPPSFNDTVYP